MGAITDQARHDQDTAQLRALAELCPVYRRHLSHHLRNCLAGMLGSCDLAQRDLAEGNHEALVNHLARLNMACEHLMADITEAGL